MSDIKFVCLDCIELKAELSAARVESDSVHKMFDTEHEQLLRVEKKNKQLQAENERLNILSCDLQNESAGYLCRVKTILNRWVKVDYTQCPRCDRYKLYKTANYYLRCSNPGCGWREDDDKYNDQPKEQPK